MELSLVELKSVLVEDGDCFFYLLCPEQLYNTKGAEPSSLARERGCVAKFTVNNPSYKFRWEPFTFKDEHSCIFIAEHFLCLFSVVLIGHSEIPWIGLLFEYRNFILHIGIDDVVPDAVDILYPRIWIVNNFLSFADLREFFGAYISCIHLLLFLFSTVKLIIDFGMRKHIII